MYKNVIIQNLLNLNWFGSGTFHRASFFTGQTLLALVTIALILTVVCGSHLTLYYHLTYIPMSCVQLTNGVQVSGWLSKVSQKPYTMEGVASHTAAWPHIWTTYNARSAYVLPILDTFLIFVIELRDGTPTSDEGGDDDEAALLEIFTPNQSTVS